MHLSSLVKAMGLPFVILSPVCVSLGLSVALALLYSSQGV